MGIDRMENNSYGKHLLEITLIVINRIGFIEKKVIRGIKKINNSGGSLFVRELINMTIDRIENNSYGKRFELTRMELNL